MATTDLQAELSLLRAERQVLHTALGQQVAERPWPAEGDTILIDTAWDGRALHGQDSFLVLSAGSKVKISHVSEEGWLWGTVESTGQSGWLGGHGCSADQQVTVSVPLGPSDPSTVLPSQPPREVQYAGQLWDCELQEFFDKYGVDDSAQQALKELPLEQQKQVAETELMNCRNPSAVLLSRIRALQRQRAVGVGTAALVAVPARPRSRSPKRLALASPEEVEEYILRHEVDEAAAGALRGLPADRQLEVMSSDLNNCRNPSAVLMGRIRAMELGSRQNQLQIASIAAAAGQLGAAPLLSLPVQSQPHPSALAAGQAHMRVEEFIQRHGLDEAAAQALRDLPVPSQLSIIEVDLVKVRNPSAVVQSRIQSYRHGNAGTGAGAAFGGGSYVPAGGHAGGGQAAIIEEYIRRFSLDEKVAHELRMLDAEAQRHVMESDVVNARNPSAVVTSRIQEAKSRSANPFTSFGR